MTFRRYFIKTCARDTEWLGYLLRSLAKFDPDAAVTVAVDDDAVPPATLHFIDQEGRFRLRSWPPHIACLVSALWPDAIKIRDPYIRQQFCKMTADRVFPDGVHIQIDSDCFMLRPPVLGDFELESADGPRPLWFREPYANLPGVPWRAPTEAALGWPVACEYMRRCALPVAADVLRDVREHIEIRHGMPLADYLAGVSSFSEYNAIGAWIDDDIGTRRAALFATPSRYGYVMLDTPRPGGSWGLPDSPCVEQGWSARPMDDQRRERYERILAG